ncbi:uncharacterized protein LOC109545324 isoform X2 [Dendroctonus ponderosae]|uniref:MARVEL domain-containing protein n=1 Tax=Dendroctonus ponderosae TaxID=77166 RepID=A0AAR5QE99_DENPD|nr:uncharacterized protein LOC109545324 isoform X2 [Dendroctonus ponderosae]KAH1016790.1 hypothetical protein HUJ04_007960 [Dendroctonus ponderosae]
MYEDTILPVRNKLRIQSESQIRIYFVQEETTRSLTVLKWLELATCLLSLCFTIAAINATLGAINGATLILSTSFSTILVMAEVTYQYFKRALPLTLQVLAAGVNLALFTGVTFYIYKMHSPHELIQVLLVLDGIIAIVFLVDVTSKIIISTYLFQTTRVKSVADVGVSAFVTPPSYGRPKPPRSVQTTTPITYGGTFPIGKNQPPFLPQERSFSPEDYSPSERSHRHKSAQTAHFGDCRSVAEAASAERSIKKPQMVQLFARQENKGTSTVPPFYLDEERRKKSPWTCSTPNTSRKFEARKQASMSTPITYSGTFAVNKELVPITLEGIKGTSPKSSPRARKLHRSEKKSPDKAEGAFLDIGRLDHISEEKLALQLSAENCSIGRSNCGFFDAPVLPGTVLDGCD